MALLGDHPVKLLELHEAKHQASLRMFFPWEDHEKPLRKTNVALASHSVSRFQILAWLSSFSLFQGSVLYICGIVLRSTVSNASAEMSDRPKNLRFRKWLSFLVSRRSPPTHPFVAEVWGSRSLSIQPYRRRWLQCGLHVWGRILRNRLEVHVHCLESQSFCLSFVAKTASQQLVRSFDASSVTATAKA